ncbi:hypothetical protein AMTRI_Chr03g46430 [Amborella trichopoda]
MGMSFSTYTGIWSDVEDPNDDASKDETVFVRSISFNGLDVKTTMRSVSFNGRDSSEDSILKSFGRSSGRLVIEGSVSFKKRDPMNPFEMETTISIKSPDSDSDTNGHVNPKSKETRSVFLRSNSLAEKSGSKHEAAVKLQKVYKSYRTRRNLADCAVVAEELWWKALEFAALKRSSVSFFDIGKSESAVSKWSRARIRAAKVGKGLSKDEKAQKLALQHWLEAIDPRHRYGHNLHFYYDTWFDCESRQPYFYWLDVGEGREVNLERCPRSKLQQQCIKYLGPKEREAYEVIVKDGKFVYKKNGELLDTSEGPKDSKWIFVLSTSKALYVGQKQKGMFQHSSFLSGGATSAAGRLVVEKGCLKVVWPYSGHYRPTEENFQEFLSFLKENKVDLTGVKLRSVDEDDAQSKQGGNASLRSVASESDIAKDSNNLSIPQRGESFGALNRISSFLKGEEEEDNKVNFSNKKLHSREEEGGEETRIPEESILKRINSKKGMQSYQLGKQLSCKWTTGVGPRIGCVRDYPSELQWRALEQVNLSPRSCSCPKTSFLTSSIASPRACSVLKESNNIGSPLCSAN